MVATSHMQLLSTGNVVSLNWDVLNEKYTPDFRVSHEKKDVKHLNNFFFFLLIVCLHNILDIL